MSFLHPCRHCGQHFPTQLDRIEHKLDALLIEQEKIVTDQDRLDADVQALTTGLDAIEQEIAALKTQPGGTALDFTALDAVVARVKGDATPPAAEPTPAAEPVPADVPADTVAETPAE